MILVVVAATSDLLFDGPHLIQTENRERDKEIEQKPRFLYFNLSENISFSIAWVSAHTKVFCTQTAIGNS